MHNPVFSYFFVHNSIVFHYIDKVLSVVSYEYLYLLAMMVGHWHILLGILPKFLPYIIVNDQLLLVYCLMINTVLTCISVFNQYIFSELCIPIYT